MLWMPILGCLLSLLSIALLVGSVVTFIRQRQKFAERTSTTGVVLSLQMRTNTSSQGGGGVIYCPVVEFMTGQGQTIHFESDYGTMPASHSVGQTVKVSYNQLDPQQAEIDSATSRVMNSLILGFMGLVLLCVGSVFLLMGTFVTLLQK